MRYALSDYLEIYVTKWDELVEEFLRHLSMTSLAVLLALVIGVPLGIFTPPPRCSTYRRRR